MIDYANIHDGLYSDDDYADAGDERAAIRSAVRAEEAEEAELGALEGEQLSREAEERETSDVHTVTRHTEFYPLTPMSAGVPASIVIEQADDITFATFDLDIDGTPHRISEVYGPSHVPGVSPYGVWVTETHGVHHAAESFAELVGKVRAVIAQHAD